MSTNLEIIGKLETRARAENNCNEESIAKQECAPEGLYHRIDIIFRDGCLSYNMSVDFVFDNTEDYVEYEEYTETDENGNASTKIMGVGKQRMKQQYDIQYGEGEGVCSRHIFSDLANLVETNKTFKSALGTISKSSPESYNTIFGNFTFSEGKLMVVKNDRLCCEKNEFCVEVTEFNEKLIAKSLRDIDALISRTFEEFYCGVADHRGECIDEPERQEYYPSETMNSLGRVTIK